MPTRIIVRGIDKEMVGQVAADIRKLRKPEPYKGKGVRYAGERVAAQGRKGGEVDGTRPSDQRAGCASGATPGSGSKVTGTPERPRLAVFRSNRHISAQVIDDISGRTLAAASSVEPELRASLGGAGGGNVTGAEAVGPPARLDGPRRPASPRWSSTVAASSTTGGSPSWPTRPGPRDWSSEHG